MNSILRYPAAAWLVFLLFAPLSLMAADPVTAVADGALAEVITGEFEHVDATETTLPFWIYGSKRLKKSETYSLVIALHGRRDNVAPGAKFTPQGMATCWTEEKTYRKRPCFVIEPYYPPKSGWDEVKDKLIATIEFAFANLPVDRSRVYITGFSNGGQGTFMMLAEKPDWFAGAVTISGPVGVDQVAGKIVAPLWAWVGEEDHDMDKVGRVTQLVEALKASGHPVKFDIVKGAGHNCTDKAYGNEAVHEWLFEQVKK